MNLIPLGDKVIVKRDDADQKTPGGIMLPDMAKEKPQRGKVLAVGDGKLLDSGARSEMRVKDGDRVLFSSYRGSEVSVEGSEYVIVSEDDILAILK